MMKTLTRIGILAGLTALAFLINPDVTRAQNSRGCAWPITASPEGSGNVVLPESSARDFFMPFDSTQFDTMTIKGTYPDVRYFSLVVYKTSGPGQPVEGVAGSLYDAEIAPDPGSSNPFVGPGAGNGTWTIVVSHGGTTSGNTIGFSSDFVWVFLRMYVPSADPSEGGHTLTGGVPLPTISVTEDGNTQELPTCSPIQKLPDVEALLSGLFPVDLQGTEGTPSSDRLWFAPVINPPAVMPNPDNKYLAMLPGDHYQPGRIIVIRGKAPGFPNTFNGSPIWKPSRGFRAVDLRYWSLCNNDFVLPVPVDGCLADLTTNVEGGYYTVVMSDDLLRPNWLRPDINWLAYGDEQYPKLVLFRNMLPAPNFRFSVQETLNPVNGCGFDLASSFPKIPASDDLRTAGQCAQGVMRDYYPVAAWCNKSTFIHGGWQACLKGRGL
jgi:hypothetical protein